MSRHEFTGNRPNIRIVVGWDRPLNTFFTQVWDVGEPEEGNLLLWLGADLERVEIDDLETELVPFGGIPEQVLELLRQDEEFDCHSPRSRL